MTVGWRNIPGSERKVEYRVADCVDAGFRLHSLAGALAGGA